jgi:hypothetical protein
MSSSHRKPKTPKKSSPKKRLDTLDDLKAIKADKRTVKFGSDDLPDKLKVYVSREIWASWSPIRRDSFTQIVNNPNAFFYRNRPPGDPQKYGPFTKEEEAQFLERLAYFREDLGVNAGLWGLFAVPIRGRLGYQCSNFYRLLVNEGRVQDNNYDILPDGKLQYRHQSRVADSEATRILEKEAFDFIAKCLEVEGGAVPQVTGPIRAESNRPVRPKPSKPSGEVAKPPDELECIFGRKRKLPERTFEQARELELRGRGKGGAVGRKREEGEERDRWRCPIRGARDPMTMEPMERPMMDSSGWVMDLSSWRRVFREEEEPPCRIVATCEEEVVEVTAANFQELKLHISNIAC